MALLLTVSSNILGIFTMPFILPHLLAAAPLATVAGLQGAVLEPLPLLLQLCKTILLPTMIGAAIRGFVPGKCPAAMMWFALLGATGVTNQLRVAY